MTANSTAAYIGYEYLEKSVPPSLVFPPVRYKYIRLNF